MKRLWAVCGILLTLMLLCVCHVSSLSRLTRSLNASLLRAEQQAEAGQWVQAAATTEDALSRWEAHAFYLHTTLRHTDIDEVLASFQEVLAFLRGDERQSAEYSAANARLMTRISLLLEAELPTLKNIL